MGEFFNNQSVGAGVGAFLAFALVLALDFVRPRVRAKKLIPRELEILRDFAAERCAVLRAQRGQILAGDPLPPSMYRPLNGAALDRLTHELGGYLTSDQFKALHNVLFCVAALTRQTEIIEKSLDSLARARGPDAVARERAVLVNCFDCALAQAAAIEVSTTAYLDGRYRDALQA